MSGAAAARNGSRDRHENRHENSPQPARQEVKLPFGMAADGRMVSVEAVERGVACECFCPKCQARLVAAKGEVIRHHFRHYVEGGPACSEARETAIHQFAKQIICDRLFVSLPDPLGTMIRATEETRLGDVVPDVLAEYDRGETVAIEIWVAHQVPEHKVRHYNNHRQAAVEIDLRPYRLTDKTEADWETIVLHEAERSWLSPPEQIRRAREAERQRWLKAQRERMEAELALMKQIEGNRIAAEKALHELNAEKAAHKELEALVAAMRLARQREREQRAAAEYEQLRLKRAEERAKEAECRRVMIARLQREKRCPDLQDLVRVHGGYDKITPEAWAEYDRELALWRSRTAVGDFHRHPYRDR
jgi:transcription initiation factor IIF auxiliary subunit